MSEKTTQPEEKKAAKKGDFLDLLNEMEYLQVETVKDTHGKKYMVVRVPGGYLLNGVFCQVPEMI